MKHTVSKSITSSSYVFMNPEYINSEVCSDLLYSRVHISSDVVFSKLLKKSSIVQEKMIPHIKAIFIGKKQKTNKIKKKTKIKMAD